MLLLFLLLFFRYQHGRRTEAKQTQRPEAIGGFSLQVHDCLQGQDLYQKANRRIFHPQICGHKNKYRRSCGTEI